MGTSLENGWSVLGLRWRESFLIPEQAALTAELWCGGAATSCELKYRGFALCSYKHTQNNQADARNDGV